MSTMIRPVSTKQTWRDAGLCLSEDPELFFPDSEKSPRGQRQTTEAKRICQACPALAQCREDVLATEGMKQVDSRHGIRGGLTPHERLNAARRASRAAAA